METLSLVKASIRNRKGTMISFMLLTMFIVVSVITMIGVRKNYETATEEAFKIEDKGVIFAYFDNSKYSEGLKKKVEAEDTVDHVEVYDALVGRKATVGKKEESNGYFVTKMLDTLPIMNSDCSDLIMPGTKEHASLGLKKGEIYLPYGIHGTLGAEAGGKISIDFMDETREFTVKGFVQDAYMGSSIMGWKTVFLNEEDFDEIYANVEKQSDELQDKNNSFYGKITYVFPTEKADESSNVFLRDLNLATKFDDLSISSLSKETAEHYTGIFINIILAVITGFAVLLLAIFIIVAGHNISTETEIDYVNLGILKSQGFTNKKIRTIYVIQYLFVELVGVILGVIVSIPLERVMSSVFFELTSIIPAKQVPVLEAVVFTVALFLVTVIFVWIFTRRVSRTTPVKAITKGRDDFYFDSRINAPIFKKGQGFWLGLRQITSAPKRYISIIVVTSLLIFTIITVELMGGFIQSREALESMGEPFYEIEYAFNVNEPKYSTEDIEEIVEKYSNIKSKQYWSHIYMSIEGENVSCIVKAFPDQLSTVYKGRDIKYDNEIVITEQISDLLDINVGDTVSIGRDELSEDFVVVGIFQTMNDTGKCISMSLEGLDRLKKDKTKKYKYNQLSMHGIILDDPSNGKKIEEEVKEKYGDEVEIIFSDFNKDKAMFVNNFYTAADGSRILIYTLSFIFAIVTVLMVCNKAFIQERTDLGIYRAVGFSVGSIRRQFATRFTILCLISSVFGIIIARLFSEKMMSSVFAMFGIPHVVLDFDFWFFMKPILVFLVVYFIFGYIASRKVKKLSSRELITE